MGYITDFSGSFQLDRPLDPDTLALLRGLSSTRRMKRQGLGAEFGEEGEFYYNPKSNDYGQEQEESVLDYNSPPASQPGLWCQWAPSDDGLSIWWDGGEKFYHYVEWIEYLIEKILAPRGYLLNGEVEWSGEDSDDMGLIRIMANVVTVLRGRIVYEVEP